MRRSVLRWRRNRGSHSSASGVMPGWSRASAARESVRDQIAKAGEELGAHARMKAIPIGTAECEQTDGAFLPQRHERDRADVVGIGAEQKITLRVASLSATGLAACEQRLERFEVRVVHRNRAH